MWCHTTVALVDCVLILVFRHLVFPGVVWRILIKARLLGKAGGAMTQTMEFRGPMLLAVHQVDEAGKGLVEAECQAGCSWGSKDLCMEARQTWGPARFLQTERQAKSQMIEVRSLQNFPLLGMPQMGQTEKGLLGQKWSTSLVIQGNANQNNCEILPYTQQNG